MFDLLGIRRALEDIATQLRRLADVSEKKSGFLALGDPTTPDGSGVFYVSDEEQARREAGRMAYQLRTGQRLAEWEDPPAPTKSDGSGWGS